MDVSLDILKLLLEASFTQQKFSYFKFGGAIILMVFTRTSWTSANNYHSKYFFWVITIRRSQSGHNSPIHVYIGMCAITKIQLQHVIIIYI